MRRPPSHPKEIRASHLLSARNRTRPSPAPRRFDLLMGCFSEFCGDNFVAFPALETWLRAKNPRDCPTLRAWVLLRRPIFLNRHPELSGLGFVALPVGIAD